MKQKEIFELIDKFEESRLAEIKIESEGFKITLKSPDAGSTAIPMPVPGYPPVDPTPMAPQQVPVEDPPKHAAGGAPTSADAEIVTSPVVGTFYRSPAPDAPAFVDEGSTVAAGDSICVIEAMKIMNKLEAEFSCEIVKILAENGQMVEFGTPLFEVRRT